jgi:hypothetical protein
MNNVFTGELVRLSAFDPQEMSKAWSRWNRNSEYFRLLNSSGRAIQSPKAGLKWMEEEVAEMSPASYFFSIRTLADDTLIGELAWMWSTGPVGMPSSAWGSARPNTGEKAMAQM